MCKTDTTVVANNSQHYWMLHLAPVCTPCCLLLKVVAQSLKPSNLKLCANGRNNSQQCSICLHGALHLTLFLFHWQVIHLKRFQLVNNHWVKSNKIVQFPMEGFDPSAFLAKPSRSGTSSAITSDGGVTTVNVKSSEELVNDEETEERKEATARQGSEVSRDIALSV